MVYFTVTLSEKQTKISFNFKIIHWHLLKMFLVCDVCSDDWFVIWVVFLFFLLNWVIKSEWMSRSILIQSSCSVYQLTRLTVNNLKFCTVHHTNHFRKIKTILHESYDSVEYFYDHFYGAFVIFLKIESFSHH